MSLDLILVRERPRLGATPGVLNIFNPDLVGRSLADFSCRTLEDAPVLTIGIPGTVIATQPDALTATKTDGRTAIPAGRYRVGLSFSNRFQKLLPELFDVPKFTAIRIHAGNRPEDTDGCILVGEIQTVDGAGRPGILRSAKAVNEIVRLLKHGLVTGDRKCWIEIRNGWL